MGMGPRRQSFTDRRNSESGNGSGPLLPLSHTGSGKVTKKGCTIPNWTVVVLLISSCLCYGLIAYAISRSNASDEDEGVVNDGTGQGLNQQDSKTGGSTASNHREGDQHHQRLQQQLGQHFRKEKQQRQWEEEQAQIQGGSTQQQPDQSQDVDRQEGGQQQQQQQQPLEEEQQEEKLQQQEELERAMQGGGLFALVRQKLHQQERLDRAMHGGGLFALSARDIHGNMRTLDEFRGKVVIVTNVASKCGFTDANYKGLQATYEKYGAYGLEILAFPCDQFGHQEPGTEEEISQFCTENYKVSFPMFSKVDVNGPNTHPVFQFLKAKLPKQKGGGNDIGWNFFKFIVDKRGNPTKMFPQTYDVARVEQEVYRLLTLPL